jgi:integrase
MIGLWVRTMASDKLTALKIRKTAAPGLYGDGRGLYLRIARGGSKSWVFRFMLDGRAREMGLGSALDISLAEARDRARAQRLLCREGTDPIDARNQRRAAHRLEAAKAMTFGECAQAYIRAHRSEWGAKHTRAWNKTFFDAAPHVPVAIAELPVASIDEAIVMRVLQPLLQSHPSTASRVRGRIENVLDWATASKFRQGENPARWRGHLEHLVAKAPSEDKRLAALPYSEIGAFMAELRQQDGVAARALEFAVLTAARAAPVFGATWSEIDVEARLWIIPAERMKAGAQHEVPLSDAALAVLDEMGRIRQGELVFEGARAGRPLSHAAMTRVLEAMGRNVTAHGFRSTFRDWCGDQTNFPREIAEAALAHSVGSKVEAAYRRGSALEKRRQAYGGMGPVPRRAGDRRQSRAARSPVRYTKSILPPTESAASSTNSTSSSTKSRRWPH